MVNNQSSAPVAATPRDDAILPLTRVVAAAVIPFLLVAFAILYLRLLEMGRWFAWDIAAPITAALMGAGYLGGAYFFARVLAARRWSHVAAGFPPVAVFTVAMLAATLLHWDTFDPGHWPFLVWLVIYLVTPILVTAAWHLNRRRDPNDRQPDSDPSTVPALVRRVVFIIGMFLLAEAAVLFLGPGIAADRWPWPLTPLTARVLAGWQLLLAVGALTLAGESRWSAWRIPLQSILVWQLLLLAAMIVHRETLTDGRLLNWFTLYTVGGLIGSAVFYAVMERRQLGSEDG